MTGAGRGVVVSNPATTRGWSREYCENKICNLRIRKCEDILIEEGSTLDFED